MGEWNSQPANHFRGRALPETGVPVGYSMLIDRFDLRVPLPPLLTAIALRHHPRPGGGWTMLTPRHRPRDTLEAQLAFALKWEGVEIDWQPTSDGNVAVLNDTAMYYRYFDATAHAEFLYGAVEQTILHDLPEEVAFIEAFDAFSIAVKELVEMPDRQIDRLWRFLEQGEGQLSARARTREFEALTDAEVALVQALFADSFGSRTSPTPPNS